MTATTRLYQVPEKYEYKHDAYGNHNYLSIKGNFVYDDHVIPEYFWFNGTSNHQLVSDKIDTVPFLFGSNDASSLAIIFQ